MVSCEPKLVPPVAAVQLGDPTNEYCPRLQCVGKAVLRGVWVTPNQLSHLKVSPQLVGRPPYMDNLSPSANF